MDDKKVGSSFYNAVGSHNSQRYYFKAVQAKEADVLMEDREHLTEAPVNSHEVKKYRRCSREISR